MPRFKLYSCVGNANIDRKLPQRLASGALQRQVLDSAVRGWYSQRVLRPDCRLLPKDRVSALHILLIPSFYLHSSKVVGRRRQHRTNARAVGAILRTDDRNDSFHA